MKRFTETTKWADPWYRRLSPVSKLLWLYLTDNCDCTGLIDLDIESATFHIGARVEEKHIAELVDRVQRTVDGKIYISRFIPFQYGTLSDGCPAHKPVIKLVTERNLSINGKGYQYPNATLTLELPNSTGKGKGKGQEGECEGESRNGTSDFEQFWQAYPRKKSKGDAERAWKKPHPDLDIILGAITRAKKSLDWTKDGGQFIPYPASWLNDRGWEDEPTKPREAKVW